MSTGNIGKEKLSFIAKDEQLCLQTEGQKDSPIEINISPLQSNGQKVVGCNQADGLKPESVKLCVVLSNGENHKIYQAFISDLHQVMESGRINSHLFKKVFTSDSPIKKVSIVDDGVFVSSEDGGLHYGQLKNAQPQVFALVNGRTQQLKNAKTGKSSGPLDDVIAAKDGISEFLKNLCDAAPQLAKAFENKVAAEGKSLFDDFASDIKTQQQNLDKIFDKPLASFIEQHSQTVQSANTTAMSFMSGQSDEHATRRLLFNELNAGKYFDIYSTRTTKVAVKAKQGSPDISGDLLEELGKLFEPFDTLLNAKNTSAFLGMGAEDLLEFISGSKPFSDVLNDCFNIFKIDEAMDSFYSVFSNGNFSSLVGQINIKKYLEQSVENNFFQALYRHYFPEKTFTTLDLISFLGALISYVIFEAQGKGDEFNSVFTNSESLQELTSAPQSIVQLMGGQLDALKEDGSSSLVENQHRPIMAFVVESTLNKAALGSTPPAWRVAVSSVLSSLLTLLIGIAGVFSFGTGLIASPVTGGFAGGISQGLFGILQNNDTSDVKWDLLSGFTGGFAGAFLSTLIGNKLFGVWAQKGSTPSARIQKLKFIMLGFTLTLGGGGGAVVSALVKSYAKTGKISFDEPLAVSTGAVAGIGGGAMGCGLHFMGALSGSKCLPVELSLADANGMTMNAIAGAPVVMNNVTPLPGAAAGFPTSVPAGGGSPPPAMGVYRTKFADLAANPVAGQSIAFVKMQEFINMDGPLGPTTYFGKRNRLFWLDSTAAVDGAVGPPPAAEIADLVIGVHGIGRYVFPCITHSDPAGGLAIDFTRPMYKSDFAAYLAADAWITGFLAGKRLPIIKLAVCFSALPLGCCSLGQELATRLNATVYAGRPPVYPWLDSNSRPQVPSRGGWIRYTP